MDKLARQAWSVRAHESFWHFCLYMDYAFFKTREAVLRPVCEMFQAFFDWQYRIIYLALPPRTGKSYTCTLFVCFFLGHYPDKAVMRNTVTGDLFKDFSIDARNIISGQTHGARYLDVFPKQRLATTNTTSWRLVSNHGRISYYGAGVGGNVIGKGAALGILDDSVKNAEMAMSEKQLQKIWAWYTSTHLTRIESPKREIHIATRWSKRDVPGRLIESGVFRKSDAAMLVQPALVNGYSFCEEVITTEEINDLQKMMPKPLFEAEMQQNPVEAKGLVFPVDSLKRFSLDDITKPPDMIILFGDTADEGTDFLSVPVGYVYGEDVYVIDVIYTDEPMEITEPRTAEFIDEHEPDVAVIESNNGGRGFARAVQKLVKSGVTVQWRRTVANKHAKIVIKSGWIKEHMHFRDDYEMGSEYEQYFINMTSYNRAGSVEHDDAPDSTTELAGLLDVEKWGF